MSEPSSRPDFDQLLEHRGWVRRLCRQLVAQPADADEVEQETWRRALAAPPRHGSNVRGWLSAVARSVSAQKWRSDARRRAAYDRLGHRESSNLDRADTPSDLIEQRETFAVLTRAILELESPYGEVVFLRYVESLPPRRIAERLQLDVGLVKSRLHRGLTMLRARVAQEIGDDWNARLLVFTPSLTAVSSAALWTTVMPLTKTKIAAGVAAVVFIAAAYQLQESDPGKETSTEKLVAVVEEEATVKSVHPVVPSAIETVERTRTEESLPSVVAAQSGSRFRVVDAVTREPRPDAEAFLIDYGSSFPDGNSAYGDQLGAGRWDSEWLAEQFGERIKLDHEGWGSIPRSIDDPGFRLVARTEQEYGMTYLQQFSGLDEVFEAEVRISKRVHLPVQVRFPNGDPAPGVDVRWGVLFSEPEDIFDLEQARTDQSGRAVFRNLRAGHLQLGANGSPFVVIARAPTLQLHWTEVDMASEDLQVAQLTVPRMVPLEVRVPGRLTMKHQGEWIVQLISAEDMPKSGSFIGPLGGKTVLSEALLQDGVVRFTRVEPGFQGYILLPLRKGDGYENAIWQWCEVPKDAKSVVRISLIEPEQVEPIRLRIVGLPESLQEPLQWHVEMSALATEEILQQKADVVFNDEGEVEIMETTSYRYTHPVERPYVIELNSEQVDGRVYSLIAQADMALLAGSNGAIEIPFHNDLIASGRIVDSVGKPVAGLAVRCMAGRIQGSSNSRLVFPGVTLTTTEDGYFELRGDINRFPKHFPGRMRVTRRGERSRQMEFEVGVPMQTFVYSRSAQLEGFIWLDLPDTQPPSCALRDRQGNDVGANVSINRDSGAIVASGIAPGEYQLVIYDIFGVHLFRSEFFELRAGEVAAPEDLQRVDLRGMLSTHRVRGFAPDGTECEQIHISRTELGLTARFRSGQAFSVADASFVAMVEADGFMARSGVEIAGECRVDFDAALEFEVHLPSGIADPEEKREWVLIASKRRDGAVGEHRIAIPAVEGANHFSLPASGEWQLGLGWQTKRGESDRDRVDYSFQIGSAELDFEQPVTIDSALPESLTFDWPLDVEKARAEIVKRD